MASSLGTIGGFLLATSLSSVLLVRAGSSQELAKTPDAALDAGPLQPDAGTAAAVSDAPPPPPAMDGLAHLVALLENGKEAPTLVGRSGELYHPSGELEWRRSEAGGVSTSVERVYRTQAGVLYAAGDHAPLFKREAGVWYAAPLENRGIAATSAGALPLISTRRHIYELGGQGWRRIASARAAVRVLWASNVSQIFVSTGGDQLWVGKGNSWRPIPITLSAGDSIERLVGVPGSAPIAITRSSQIFELGPRRANRLNLGPSFSSFKFQTGGNVGGRLLLAGQLASPAGARSVLLELSNGRVQLADELWPLVEGDHFAIVAQDPQKRLLVASHFGQLRRRESDGSWRNGTVRAQLPPSPRPRPGVAPARSR